MKTQPAPKTLALALGASLLACAQTTPASADAGKLAAQLPVKERFVFGEDSIQLTKFEGGGWRSWKLVPELGEAYDCDEKVNATSVTADITFPFISWQDITTDIPLQEPYFRYYFRFFKSNSCTFDTSEIELAHILPYLGSKSLKSGWNVKSELTLDRLSADGSAIEATYRLRGDFLKDLLITRNNELTSYLQLTLAGCSTADGVWVSGTELRGMSRSDSIRDLIADLRAVPLRQFVQCMIAVSDKGRISPEISKKGRFQFTSGTCNNSYDCSGKFNHFMIQEGAEALYQVDTDHKFVKEVPRVTSGIDPAAESVVHGAMEEFISWLKGDYLDFVDQLNSRNPNPADRLEALRAFTQKNKAMITAWLSTIDQNLQSLPLMSKMSVLMNINQAYQAVGQIERQAQISEGVLDRIIRKNVN